MTTYWDAKSAGYRSRDRGFCSVTAVAVATDNDFDHVQWLFGELGRNRRQGTPMVVTEAVIGFLGFRMKRITEELQTKTVRVFARDEADDEMTYIIRTGGYSKSHLLCYKNGQIED